MFFWFPLIWLAQSADMPITNQEIIQPQQVRPLPGSLNKIPVFNSNSPELVQQEGILLSTFPPDHKTHPQAHLNFAFQGRFDLFTHHINKANSSNLKTLYLGVIAYNPSDKPIKINLLQAASYLSQPDAPFIDLPSIVDNNLGNVYSGPGSRVMNEILRGYHQADFPSEIVIPPRESRMIFNLPIPIEGLEPPINGRSSYIRLMSDGRVYLASLAMYARQDEQGNQRSPSLEEWQELLVKGDLVQPRDKTPTPLGSSGNIIYGRVAGVSQGQEWQAELVDNPKSRILTIPNPGQAFSYGISTLEKGRLGTKQIQSAPMLVRYPDTAYLANGNYGVRYSLTLPLYNPSQDSQSVTISIQTPIKEDELNQGLRFLKSPTKQIFFRGTVEVSYKDSLGLPRINYFHLVQKRGQEGDPLITLKMLPKEQHLVRINFIYPPDASPPQVITVTNTNE